MSFEETMRLAQQRGFFFKAAESYPNSPAGFWDYGPLGVSLKNKFVELWRRLLVKKDGMVEIDGAQILPKAVFEGSGHLTGFTDPIVECSNCHSVYRADKLIEEKTGKITPEKLSDKEFDELLAKNGVRCPNCGSKLSGTKRFNMMFRVGVGALGEDAYLRPETAQTIFVDFPLLFKTQRIKLPIGLAQYGKSFRNEIAPRQGLIRLRELIQAEVEVFFNPRTTEAVEKFGGKLATRLGILLPDGSSRRVSVAESIESGWVPNRLIGYYLALAEEFYEAAGLDPEKIRFRKLSDSEKAFYAEVAYDLEVETSIGWVELVACNYRGSHDMSGHARVSGTNFEVDDGGEKLLPHIFELSMGVDRSLYVLLEAAQRAEGDRKYLSLRPFLAPLQVGVFPLVSKERIPEEANRIFLKLRERFDAFYDEAGSIGKRYARADEVGTPYCITVDFQSLKDGSMTIRNRDAKSQERVAREEVEHKLGELLRWPPIQ